MVLTDNTYATPRALLTDLVVEVDVALRGLFERLPGTHLYDLMRYHLGWKDESLRDVDAPGGKRLRPLICLLACDAAGGDRAHALPAAVGLELLHNFTLIHDDIEDGDAVRRHRPTVWRLWGVPQALNVGDGMHALAKIAALDDLGGLISERTILRLAGCISEASLQLCEGQDFDLRQAGVWDVTLEQYLAMVKRKAGSLIACAARCGAVVATDDRRIQHCYADFGELLGMAFQITDDLLAIWGDEDATGKPTSDLSHSKMTLPLIYAHQQAGSAAAKRLEAALQGEPSQADLAEAYAVLQDTGAQQWTIRTAMHYRDLALASLDATGISNPAQDALRYVAGFSVERTY